MAQRRAPRKPRTSKGKKLTRDERIAMFHPEVAGVWDGCDIDGFCTFNVLTIPRGYEESSATILLTIPRG
jgi:hypothetical protein